MALVSAVPRLVRFMEPAARVLAPVAAAVLAPMQQEVAVGERVAAVPVAGVLRAGEREAAEGHQSAVLVLGQLEEYLLLHQGVLREVVAGHIAEIYFCVFSIKHLMALEEATASQQLRGATAALAAAEARETLLRKGVTAASVAVARMGTLRLEVTVDLVAGEDTVTGRSKVAMGVSAEVGVPEGVPLGPKEPAAPA